MKKLSVILSISLIALSISCKNKKKVETAHEVLPTNIVEMNDPQYKSAGIELGQIMLKELGSTLSVSGIIKVAPQNFISVSANMGGFVKNTNLVQGCSVTKGQVLATIENQEFIELQQNYLENKSRYEFVEADYNRQKELYKENVSSAKNFQQIQADYKSIKSKVFALAQKLALIGIDADKLTEEKISRSIAITSPIAGYIKSVNVNIGKYVNPTDVMFEVVNNQNLTLELTLFEKDIDKVKPNQKISFFMPNAPDKKQTATIYQVGKAINDDKTVKVYATIDKENTELLSGMYVKASIEVTNNQGTAVPDDAIVSFDDKHYIFVMKGKRTEDGKNVTDFQMVEVKIGATNGGFTEVILPNDFDILKTKIVIKGAYSLLSALKNAGEMSC